MIDIEHSIQILREQLTGNLLADCEIQEQIKDLESLLDEEVDNPVCDIDDEDCIACGS